MQRTFHQPLHLFLLLFVALASVACGTAPDSPSQVSEDGWVRYAVPDAPIMIELPEQFTTFLLTSDSFSEGQTQLESQFPAAGRGYNLSSLYETGARLAAFDRERSQNLFPIANFIAFATPVVEGSTVRVSTQSQIDSLTQVGGEVVVAPIYSEIGGGESVQFSFVIPTTLSNTAAQRADQLLFVVGDHEYHLQLIYPLDQAESYSPMADEIFNRVSVTQ